MDLPKKKFRIRKLLGWLTLGTALLVLGAVLAYRFSPQLLTIDSGECKADAIVVLGGDAHGRPIRAAELFKAGAASWVIASGNGDCEEIVRTLEQNGVPEAALVREDQSATTRENAQFSVKLLRERHARSAIVVTSWYHSRRALKSFKKAAPRCSFIHGLLIGTWIRGSGGEMELGTMCGWSI